MKVYQIMLATLILLTTAAVQQLNAQTTPPSKEEREEKKVVFYIVEQRAEPIGGIKALSEYVSKHLKYPRKARRAGIQGRVIVDVVIEKDGTLSNFKIRKGIGGGCDEEAIRVLKKLPKWKPAKQRGRFVKYRVFIPILFNLNSRKK